MRLLETDRGYLSLSFDVKNNDFTTINIADFVDDIINDRDAELVRNTPSLRAGVGLRYSHAFSPLVGLISFFETGYGESVDRVSEDEWFTRFGGTVDFDLAAANWLPIGLAAGYAQDSFPEGGADITDVVRSFLFRAIWQRLMTPNFASIMPQVIGVWSEELGHVVRVECYTGREDLALGLNFVYSTFPTDQLDTKIKSTGIDFDIRYYF